MKPKTTKPISRGKADSVPLQFRLTTILLTLATAFSLALWPSAAQDTLKFRIEASDPANPETNDTVIFSGIVETDSTVSGLWNAFPSATITEAKVQFEDGSQVEFSGSGDNGLLRVDVYASSTTFLGGDGIYTDQFGNEAPTEADNFNIWELDQAVDPLSDENLFGWLKDGSREVVGGEVRFGAGSQVPHNIWNIDLFTVIGAPAETVVPNIVGLQLQDAQGTIEAVDGLIFGDFASQPSATVPADHVISQDPPAGTIVAAPTTVNGTVSTGPDQAAANDIDPAVEFQTVALASGQIVVDGNLGDLVGDPVVDPEFSIPKGSGQGGPFVTYEENGGVWTGPEDHSVTMRFSYDSDAVYLGLTVTDDYHVNHNSDLWAGDSAQLMVTNGDRTDQVALYNYALQGTDGAIGNVIVQTEAGPGGTTAAIVRVGTTTTYEICLPKESLGLGELAPGVRFGLGFALNDGDEDVPGQSGWSGWGPHSIVFEKSPSHTGILILANEEPAPPITDGCLSIADYPVMLNGDALTGDAINGLQLTADAQDQIGSVFFLQPVSLLGSFEMSGSATIAPPTSGEPADGFALVLQDAAPDYLGGGGGSMGFASAYPGDGLAVEFDTWDNGTGEGEGQAAGVPHLGINRGFSVESTTAAPLFQIATEDEFYFWVDGRFDPNTGSLIVETYVSQSPDRPADPIVTSSLAGWGLPSAYVGVTSATGAATSAHTIHNLHVCVTPPAIPIDPKVVKQGCVKQNGLNAVFAQYDGNITGFETISTLLQTGSFAGVINWLNFVDTPPEIDPMDIFVKGEPVDPSLNIVFEQTSGERFPHDETFDSVFTTCLCVETPGTYTITLGHDDGVRAWIGDRQILEFNAGTSYRETSALVSFAVPGYYDLKVHHYEDQVESNLVLKWTRPDSVTEVIPESNLVAELCPAPWSKEIAIFGSEETKVKEGASVTGSIGSGKVVETEMNVAVDGSVIAVTDKVTFDDFSSVSGDIDAQLEIKLDKDCVVGGSLTSHEDKVEVGERGLIGGDVTAAEDVNLKDDVMVVGTVTENADLVPIDLIVLPEISEVPHGEEDFKVPEGGNRSISPGDYKKLEVGEGGTLTMQGGQAIYHLREIVWKKDAKIVIDLTGGSLVVYVDRDIETDDRVTMSAITTEGGLEAEAILFCVRDGDIKLEKEGGYLGTFLGPESHIDLQPGASLVGAIYGKKAHIKENTIFVRDPAVELLATIPKLNWPCDD